VDVEGVWTDPAQPWMQDVADVTARVTGQPAGVRAAPYFTDASVLTPAYGGAPTVILGPGELAMAHQTDEYCVVDRLGEAVEIYTELIRRWCRL
jgi:succinyl-diaminopimelate desuccinylase